MSPPRALSWIAGNDAARSHELEPASLGYIGGWRSCFRFPFQCRSSYFSFTGAHMRTY